MSIFLAVEKIIINVEGGYVRDIDDPGGETKYGISKREYPDLDIPNLTLDQAYEIYERDYWKKFNVSGLKTQRIANKFMIALINMGIYQATICLQRAINRCALYVVVDGKLGTMTFTGANTAPQGWLEDAMSLEFASFYVGLVNKYPEKIKYLKGWIRRALL